MTIINRSSSTLVLICFGVSVRYIEELASLADIFVFAPCRAGKNVEWIKAGFGKPNFGATSLVIRKYGSYVSKKKLELLENMQVCSARKETYLIDCTGN